MSKRVAIIEDDFTLVQSIVAGTEPILQSYRTVQINLDNQAKVYEDQLNNFNSYIVQYNLINGVSGGYARFDRMVEQIGSTAPPQPRENADTDLNQNFIVNIPPFDNTYWKATTGISPSNLLTIPEYNPNYRYNNNRNYTCNPTHQTQDLKPKSDDEIFQSMLSEIIKEITSDDKYKSSKGETPIIKNITIKKINPFLEDKIIKNIGNNIKYDLLNLALQLYFPLCALGPMYTHYDLHSDNVLVIILDKPIIIEYKEDKKNITIITKYIPVIIDYGRSYTNCLGLDSLLMSRNFIESACESQECNLFASDRCEMTDVGFNSSRINYNFYHDNDTFYYINSRIPNKSHDLRLLHIVMTFLNPTELLKKKYNKFANNILTPEWYNVPNPLRSDITYGVKEDIDNMLPSVAKKSIKTINDAYKFLRTVYFDVMKDQIELKLITSNRNEFIGKMIINTDISKKEKWSYEKY
jgi:hypothetical protein